MIIDNILVAFAIFHDMNSHSRTNGGSAPKLDMVKAYDRVEWSFLHAVMLRLGSRESWVNLVMRCVETATFSFIIKGELRGLKPRRGIHQAGPILSYLFLFYAEGLSNLLQDVSAYDA